MLTLFRKQDFEWEFSKAASQVIEVNWSCGFIELQDIAKIAFKATTISKIHRSFILPISQLNSIRSKRCDSRTAKKSKSCHRPFRPGGGYLGYEHMGRCRWKI